MKRRVYDFFGKEINLDKEKCCPVYYVQCDWWTFSNTQK